MLEVSNVKLPLDAGLPEGGALVRAAAAAALGVAEGDVRTVRISWSAIDINQKFATLRVLNSRAIGVENA